MPVFEKIMKLIKDKSESAIFMYPQQPYIRVIDYIKMGSTHPDLLLTDGVVGIKGEVVHGEWSTLPELGRQQETH